MTLMWDVLPTLGQKSLYVEGVGGRHIDSLIQH